MHPDSLGNAPISHQFRPHTSAPPRACIISASSTATPRNTAHNSRNVLGASGAPLSRVRRDEALAAADGDGHDDGHVGGQGSAREGKETRSCPQRAAQRK